MITWRGMRTEVGGRDGFGAVAGQIGAVYGFDAASQRWQAWFPGGGPANTLAELEPWKAYFVSVRGSGPVELSVPAQPLPDGPTVSYRLWPGWNLVGWLGREVPVDAEEGFGNVQPLLGAVYGFDAAGQRWLAWFPGGGPANTLTTLRTWDAYFVSLRGGQAVDFTVPAGFEGFGLTMDWTPLLEAASAVGQDGPITLTGTLQGSPSAPLRLQLSYRPKGGDWGPWEEKATFTVEGDQVRATLPAPGLDLPVGLDELGKAVRARVVMGSQTLAESGEVPLDRFNPLWTKRLGPGLTLELSAQGSLACSYYYRNSIPTVVCLDPETGMERWRSVLPVNPYDIFVAADGTVYVGGWKNGVGAVLALREGTLLQRWDLPDFYTVTALAVEGDTLYAGGTRQTTAPCGAASRTIHRVRFGKYRLSGSTATRLALHDPSPEDLQEITSPNGCTTPGDDYSLYNSSSTPALKVVDGKLYAPFSFGAYYDGQRVYFGRGCMGFLSLDTASLARDWLVRFSDRHGASGEATWSWYCSEAEDAWFNIGRSVVFVRPPSPALWFAPSSFDVGPQAVHASQMAREVVSRESGARLTLPGDNSTYLLFLDGLEGGFARFEYDDNRRRLEVFPGGTGGPHDLNLALGPRVYEVYLARDAQGRAYVFGQDQDGQALVARLR